MGSRIEKLFELGQSVWLDFIRRGHLLSGEFDQLVRSGVVGVTSNPTIFQQAIAHGDDYEAALKILVTRGLEAPALFDALAIEDIRSACDRLLPVFQRTGGRDGRVSIEVNPELAHDSRATLEEARRLHREVARPNVMVKIPATQEGLPAITGATADGICINVTLIFSLARYEQVMDAYLTGLEQRAARDQALDTIFSVASFFVSRVDTKADPVIDQAIEKLPANDPRRAELASFKGKAAIANARLAYQAFRRVFGGPRFAELAAKGARLQRPLWASTSTKNPQYRDVLYIEELIGPDTVNTMPPQTIDAFEDHGVVEVRIEHDVPAAQALFRRLPELGVPIDDLIGQLEQEGVASFSKSYRQLIETLETKRREMHGTRWVQLQLSAGEYRTAIDKRLESLERESFPRRLWARDPSLWSSDPAHQDVARRRLGWLESAHGMKQEIQALKTFARDVAREGYTRAVLLGMGGSSLAPEVLRRTFGVAPGALDLTVLDSTSPAAVRAIVDSHDPRRTLFVVSSKSGGTIEVASFERFFFEWVEAVLGARAGASFAAITDPDSPLERLARERGYRKTFLNPPDIGGRYSALSWFGLLPAALIGAPLEALLEHAVDETEASGPSTPAARSFGIELGAALGELARAGRDKLTLVTGKELAAFGSWVEQLVAESTGKDGKGIVPVVGEALGAPDVYGNDRVFAVIAITPLTGEDEARIAALERAGHPVLRWRDREIPALGAEFLRWEIATVTAAAILGVDPFDEPNVTEAKQATQVVLQRVLADGKLPSRTSVADASGLEIETPRAVADRIGARARSGSDAAAWAAGLVSLARPGDYFAALAYFHATGERHRRLERLCAAVRSAAKIATTIGYGPRFLHSTGQLHKGGPNTGLFLQFTADEGDDVPIPGERYGFATLIRAQAVGDYQVLEKRERRVMRIHLGADPERALDEIAEAVASAHV
jgi:transaldolase / glucose-6-phosphate isomerase